MAHDVQAEQTVGTARFGDRVAEAVERKRSQLVVGLDPRPELLPVELRGDAHLGREHVAEACSRFCRGLVDAVAPYVVAVKPQLAFFEALGADGIRAFEEVCAYARAAELLVIADGKRGDVGSTARAYAAAYLGRGGRSRSRSCSCRAWARRARLRRTWPGLLRAARRARSSRSRALSSTRSGSTAPTGVPRRAPRRRACSATSGPSPAGRRCRLRGAPSSRAISPRQPSSSCSRSPCSSCARVSAGAEATARRRSSPGSSPSGRPRRPPPPRRRRR